VSLDLTDDERNELRGVGHEYPLALTAILKLQAGKMEAEFWLKHKLRWTIPDWCWICGPELDPGHTWTDEQWLEAAKEALADSEEEK